MTSSAPISLPALERLIHDESAAIPEHILHWLEVDPAAGPMIETLARHRDVDIRMWVISILETRNAPGVSDALLRLAKDRDPDIRSDAIRVLVARYPDTARRLRSTLVRRLRSTDYYEPIDAMWALAAIGDPSDADLIRSTGERWDVGDWHRTAADIISHLAHGEDGAILKRIEDHDHIGMPWLSLAAAQLGTEQALATLRRASERFAGDTRCHTAVERALAGAARRPRPL